MANMAHLRNERGADVTEEEATLLASSIGGQVWQSGGGVHVVLLRRPDGAIVAFSDDLVAEYADENALEAAAPSTTILLRSNPSEYWVVESSDGGVWMNDRTHGRGWANQEDAQEHASAIQSRIGTKCCVRQQRLSDTLGDR